MSDSGSQSGSSDAEDTQDANYAVFRDNLSTTLLQAVATTSAEPKRRRRAKPSKSGTLVSSTAARGPAPAAESKPAPERDAEELADFIDYLASEIFGSLPEDLRTLDHRTWRESEALQAQYSLPLTEDSLSTLDLPPSIPETLRTYNLIAEDSPPLPASTLAFLVPVLAAYIGAQTAPPPASRVTRASECELCGRSWIPLSYHHLIPRFVHEKAVRRGWHRREDLQNVAWLCGACHRFVHHFRGHEDLARHYYTVDRLLAEDEVRRFAAWVGRLRWKGGRTRSTRNSAP
jgi:5-methylcytosine-specific restriction endonuclease McrA